MAPSMIAATGGRRLPRGGRAARCTGRAVRVALRGLGLTAVTALTGLAVGAAAGPTSATRLTGAAAPTGPASATRLTGAAAPTGPASATRPTGARGGAPGCEPRPTSVIAGVPWPQLRYDQLALGRLADGSGTTVAVVDSGVDADHPQLAGRVPAGADLLDRGTDGRLDCLGHGTAVASIIAAQPMAGAGLRGLAPGVRILPIRVSERIETDGVISGQGTVADVAAGIRTAVAMGADVINLSISTTADDPGLRDAVERALAADVVLVAAVGNQHARGDPTPYPAGYPDVIGVGAVGPDGLRLAASSVGSYVDIVAPGDGVTVAVPGGGHAVYQGTSFAAAFVAATAALIRSHRPELHRAEIVRRLLMTTDPAAGPRPSPEYGYGMLNPIRAVTEVLPAPDRPAEPTIVAPPGPAGATGAIPIRVPAISLAAALTLIAAGVAALAAATPLGRRRRWRPGRLTGPPSTQVPEPGASAGGRPG